MDETIPFVAVWLISVLRMMKCFQMRNWKRFFSGSICLIDLTIKQAKMRRLRVMSFRISVVLGKKAQAVAWIQGKLLDEKEVQVSYLTNNGHNGRK